MQLSKERIMVLLMGVPSREDSFNELLRTSFDALMKAERQEHLLQSTEDKGNAPLIGRKEPSSDSSPMMKYWSKPSVEMSPAPAIIPRAIGS